jgi:peptidyl-prolyl cis-trans isomerase A (cyclophilin A)
VVELDREKAPKTVDNFVQYVKAGHYDGTIFHRVIENFMIQGGGMKPDMSEKPTRAPIPLEAKQRPEQRARHAGHGPHHGAGLGHRAVLHQRARQQLPRRRQLPRRHGYAVFGKVIDGMDVVDKIKTVPTANKGPHQNVPVADVVIRKATLEN